MRRLLSVFLVILGFSIVFSITLINPLGPAVIPVVAITEGKVKGAVHLNVEIWKNPEEAIAMIASKKADFYVLPITVGANLYLKGMDIVLLGVHEWNVFYMVVSEDETFSNWKDLVGKEIYTAHGRGQTVDVLMRYLMTEEGVIPDKDVRILYAPPQEIVALFKSGKIKFAALPEPFVTLCALGGKGKIALDFQKVWGDKMGIPPRLPIAGLFTSRRFLKEYPMVVEKVVELFKNSVEWMNKNLDEALVLTKKFLNIPTPVLKESMKRTKFYYVDIKDCEGEVALFLKKLNELYPEGMPGVPDEGFYAR